MKKNVQWLVIFVFALLLLTGCKGSEQETQKKNGESEDVSSKVEAFLKKETNQSSETTQLLTETDASETADMQSTESMTETEVTAWDELQGKMHENDCYIAMAFLGYISYEADEVKIRQYASQEACVQYDFPEKADLVDCGGEEVYAIVPCAGMSVSVYRVEMSEMGEYDDKLETSLYEGKKGEPILLRCNVSEIFPDVLLIVSDGRTMHLFRPMISLRDGHLAAEEGCYDFSVYEPLPDDGGEIGPFDGQNGDIAYEILNEVPEVREAIANGMQIMDTCEMEEIDGRPCRVFVLGTNHDGQFVREQYYAVSDNLVYVYDVIDDCWLIQDRN